MFGSKPSFGMSSVTSKQILSLTRSDDYAHASEEDTITRMVYRIASGQAATCRSRPELSASKNFWM